MNSPENRVIIFTRFPEPGVTKTRLIPLLGAAQAASLQKMMTEKTIEMVDQLLVRFPGEVEIRYAGGNDRLMAEWLGPGRTFISQSEGNLGQRMTSAVSAAFETGARKVVVIGTDCPSLEVSHLRKAFTILESTPLVLGPALDGGYYLIGLNTMLPELFLDVPWSSSSVLRRTVEISARLGVEPGLLEPLGDIDRPEDLADLDHMFESWQGKVLNGTERLEK